MISSLRGTVLAASGGTLQIEVGGVGYTVNVTPEHALRSRPGTEARVDTALIVREDAMTLFGFEDAERLELFRLLLDVTGVGPRSALGVLGTLTPDEVARAVADEDDRAFKAVSGIGPKTAKLIVLSLQGKVRRSETAAPAARASMDRADVVDALVSLGWQERAAGDAVDAALSSGAAVDPGDTAALLRLALAGLGGPTRDRARS